jgi:hypothetical protein
VKHSLRQLARLIGVDDKAVRKAEKAGVFRDSIKRDDLGEVIFLDVTKAVDLWEKSGRRLRGSTPAAANQAPSAPLAAAVTSAPAAIAPPSTQTDEAGDEDGDFPPLPPDAPPSLVEMQVALARERQRKLRLENDTREGQLVEADRATREAFEFARTVRENILNVPARLAAELAAESDSTRVHLALERALREALEATAMTLETAPVEQGVSA